MTRVLGGVAAALCLLPLAGSALAQEPVNLTLVSSTDRQSLAVVGSNQDQPEMIRLADLVRIFDLDVQGEARPNTVTVTHDGRVMILTAGQPVVSVAGRLFSLRTSAPRRSGDDWFVPLEFLSRALGRLIEETITLRRPSRLVLIGDVIVPQISARYSQRGSGAQLDLEVRPAAPHTVTQERGRLILQFQADALDVGPLPSPQGDVVTRINTDPSTTRLIIDLGPAYGSFDVVSRSIRSGEQVSIALGSADQLAAAPEVPAPDAGTTPLASDAPLPEIRVAPEVRVVAIDAGHGGDDEGTRGGARRAKRMSHSAWLVDCATRSCSDSGFESS